MTVKQFIEKAIEGGWGADKFTGYFVDEKQKAQHKNCIVLSCENPKGHVFVGYELNLNDVVLDPLAWQAVGKVEKGKKWSPQKQWRDGSEIRKAGWHENMHRMIDALAEGKTIEQFLETL